MQYYSINRQSPPVNFRDAAISGQAPDKGLYFPSNIPQLSKDLLSNFQQYSKEDIAFKVIQPFVGDVIPTDTLFAICSETVNFDFPLVKVEDGIYSLELFHGPTLAFKDVGARFMSRCLGYFSKERSEKIVVLVATSGDTGGAVANGFYDVDGVEVVILYPSGKVSSVQEKQLTTLGKNIHAIEVEGNFDDCQLLVKQAFGDIDLNKQLFMTSANSINVARWLPQQFYYFFALQQWQRLESEAPVISVPSGNFGNICAGLVAWKSGLPIGHFIAACNANDTVPRFMQTGDYQPRKAVPTVSNAMDVANPSNFIRVLELFEEDDQKLKSMVSSFSFTDQETMSELKNLLVNSKYLADPHGAVGLLALRKYLQAHPRSRGFFLETAHPVKFYDVVEPVIEETIPLPLSVNAIIDREKKAVKMEVSFDSLRSFLEQLV